MWSSRLSSRARWLEFRELGSSHSWGKVSAEFYGGDTICIHKEDQPSPVLIIQCKRCTSLDEEGNENLYPFNDSLNGGISQFAAPYLEVSTFARVAFDQLSGRLKVFRRSVFLDKCVEIGCLVEGLCRRMISNSQSCEF